MGGILDPSYGAADERRARFIKRFAMWGCTPETPCKYYSPEAFNEDWGPSSAFSNISAIKVRHEDNCSSGVVFDLENPQAKPAGLFVNKDNILGFAGGPR